ncbi:hypothetical protein [Duganella sacchari]|uniref:hypothetical protein n=1 Tax=Duganella sacchari TaxID=551987 RepID=UPI00142F2E61|nr:hypothetical protein [Duganella sacchari]
MRIPLFIKEVKQFFTPTATSAAEPSTSLANVQPLKSEEYAFIAGAPQLENEPD